MRYWFLVLLLVVVTDARAQWPAGSSNAEPHPAVVRVVVPEADGTAYGSGTLIDLRDDYGLVLTNWHVVCNATGPIEVLFPSGFVSQARSLKMDSDWDLAALVIWRPPCEPVRLATRPPRPGDALTICGYGAGNYRAVTGRCTQFYAPRLDLPQELVELDVQARQGDSGGPIFNDRGELAGVLFGAGQGTTLGSFEGRVKTFLASLAPDIGASDAAPRVALQPVAPTGVAQHPRPNFRDGEFCDSGMCRPANDLGDVCLGCNSVAGHARMRATPAAGGQSPPTEEWPNIDTTVPSLGWSSAGHGAAEPAIGAVANSVANPTVTGIATPESGSEPASASTLGEGNLFQHIRNGLALVGVLAILIQVVRLAG